LPGIKRRSREKVNKFEVFNDESHHSKVPQGLFDPSPSSTVKELQRKLDEVVAPSDSENDAEDSDSHCSPIPPAHHEYEKMLRQLEAECRNHIRCEQ
jgi:hypothetical protein